MTAPEPGRIRASDTEREQVVSVLREAMGEGRLTLDEGEERITGVYAATYREELPAFTADLPPVEPAADRPHSHRRGAPRGDRPGPGGDRPGSGGPGSERPGGWGPGSGRRRSRPPVGLVALLAVAAGTWALVAGGPLWLAILLGILTLMLAKHSSADRGGCHANRRTPR